jgi:hypothetical protein
MSDSTHPERSNEGLEKVWIELKKEWGWPYATESMWAKKLAENLYALRNVSFIEFSPALVDTIRR